MSEVSHPTVAGLLLAAGGSRRLGSAKQLLRDAKGETLVHRTVRLLREAGCHPVVVVVGAQHAEVFSAIEDLKVEITINDSWQTGMGSSVAAGTRYAMTIAPSAGGLLVAACDMPGIEVSHFQELLKASNCGLQRSASEYQEDSKESLIGIPAVFPREDWPTLMALEGDQGARALLRRSPPPATVALTTGRFDLDTPDDVRRWREQADTVVDS